MGENFNNDNLGEFVLPSLHFNSLIRDQRTKREQLKSCEVVYTCRYTSGHLLPIITMIGFFFDSLSSLKLLIFTLTCLFTACSTMMTTESMCSYHIKRKNGARYSCV